MKEMFYLTMYSPHSSYMASKKNEWMNEMNKIHKQINQEANR